MEILNRIQVQGIIPVKASQFATGISIALTAHNFSKISLLRAYNAIHNYNAICLSETYLNHGTLSKNYNLKIPGYELIRVDHPPNKKRGGTCIYYKEFLPIKQIIQVVWRNV